MWPSIVAMFRQGGFVMSAVAEPEVSSGNAIETSRAKRRRVQLDFSEGTFGELERLTGVVGAESVGSFCRDAVRFYRWYVREKERGGSLLIRRDGELSIVEPLF